MLVPLNSCKSKFSCPNPNQVIAFYIKTTYLLIIKIQ